PAHAAPRSLPDALPILWTAVTRAVQQVSGAAVLAGPTDDPGDAVQAVRDDADAAAEVTTVSGITRLTGRLAVPLTVAARLEGVRSEEHTSELQSRQNLV